MIKTAKQNKFITEDTKELFYVISKLNNTEESSKFLRDLLTESEILEFAQRWKAAKMLDKRVPYSKISEVTGLSSTTIARVQKWLQDGMGGYKLMLKRIKEKK